MSLITPFPRVDVASGRLVFQSSHVHRSRIDCLVVEPQKQGIRRIMNSTPTKFQRAMHFRNGVGASVLLALVAAAGFLLDGPDRGHADRAFVEPDLPASDHREVLEVVHRHGPPASALPRTLHGDRDPGAALAHPVNEGCSSWFVMNQPDLDGSYCLLRALREVGSCNQLIRVRSLRLRRVSGFAPDRAVVREPRTDVLYVAGLQDGS